MPGKLRHLGIVIGILLVACIVAWTEFSKCEPLYEAQSKVQLRRMALTPQSPPAGADNDELAADGDEAIATSVMTLASDLLKKRGVIVSLDMSFDSEVDVLLQRTSITRERQAGQDEVTLRYRTVQQQQAVPVLTAIADAYLSSINNDAMPPASPALAALESQRNRATDGHKRQQQLIGELQKKLAEKPFPETQRATVLEKVKSLSSALGEARRRRLEAEHRLLQAKRDIEDGLPVHLLAARLPDGQSKTLLQESFETLKRKSELERQAARLQELSAIYGRHHPRMLEVQRNIEALTAQLPAAPAEQESDEEGAAVQTSNDLLLRVLASELREQQGYEESLHQQIELERIGLDQHSALQGALGVANQELVRLQAEGDSLRQRWETLHSQERPHPATLIEPAKLAAQPVWPQFQTYAASGAGAGGALSLIYLLGVALWPRAKVAPASSVTSATSFASFAASTALTTFAKSVEHRPEHDEEPGFESPRTLLERRMQRVARLQALRSGTALT